MLTEQSQAPPARALSGVEARCARARTTEQGVRRSTRRTPMRLRHASPSHLTERCGPPAPAVGHRPDGCADCRARRPGAATERGRPRTPRFDRGDIAGRSPRRSCAAGLGRCRGHRLRARCRARRLPRHRHHTGRSRCDCADGKRPLLATLRTAVAALAAPAPLPVWLAALRVNTRLRIGERTASAALLQSLRPGDVLLHCTASAAATSGEVLWGIAGARSCALRYA